MVTSVRGLFCQRSSLCLRSFAAQGSVCVRERSMRQATFSTTKITEQLGHMLHYLLLLTVGCTAPALRR